MPLDRCQSAKILPDPILYWFASYIRYDNRKPKNLAILVVARMGQSWRQIISEVKGLAFKKLEVVFDKFFLFGDHILGHLFKYFNIRGIIVWAHIYILSST